MLSQPIRGLLWTNECLDMECSIMLFLRKSQNRLVYKLIVSILIFSGTITAIITAIQLYDEYRRDVNEIGVFISKIEKSFLSPIASGLWHFDMQSVRLQLEGILRFRDIEYLEITEEGKKVVVVGSPQTKHVIVKTIPLIYNFKNQDREIGKLTVAASLARVYSRLFDRAISLLISQGIKTFLVSGFILMIFHLLVTRHLGSINSYLKSLDLKNLPRPLRLNRRVSTKHDELNQMVNSTNEMAVNLHESYETISTELELRKQAEEKLRLEIKEREEIEDALQRSRRDLQHLAGRLLTAQEAERRRLARELHDDLTQRLAVMAIEIGKLEMQPDSIPESFRDKLTNLQKEIMTLSGDIHAISRQLHPSILDDLGLVDAIRSECNNFNKREEIEVNLDLEEIPETITGNVALCIFRVVQEGLRNISKHARTGEAHIRVACHDEKIYLTIEDYGMGFDPEAVMKKPGLGLVSMEERIRLIQGKFSINSRPKKGTTININAPLSGSRS